MAGRLVNGIETRDDVTAVMWTTFCCCILDSRLEINISRAVGEARTMLSNGVLAIADRWA